MRIHCAAVRLSDGSIWEGDNHASIISQLPRNLDLSGMIMGFVTDTGRVVDGVATSSPMFVDRREAHEIALASGQIAGGGEPLLVSEMLTRPIKEGR